VLATPDGKAPQLDVNGLALSFQAAAGLGLATAQEGGRLRPRRGGPQLRGTRPRQYLSIQELITKDRDPGDDFSLGDLAFAHMPGGHAPMVDFNDNPRYRPSTCTVVVSRARTRLLSAVFSGQSTSALPVDWICQLM
jgi:hypothetical protein